LCARGRARGAVARRRRDAARAQKSTTSALPSRSFCSDDALSSAKSVMGRSGAAMFEVLRSVLDRLARQFRLV